MAEFGENLKRIREERGFTQQTLAEHLYVTRQAVSRWEGGSRYPDIMTAKRMSQFLQISLDELLSDDDMKLYVEKNAILDTSVSKKVQTILISFAFMCSLMINILYLSNHMISDSFIIESKSETIKSLLLTGILGYAVYTALFDKMNPKITSLIYTIYFGTAILTGLVGVWTATGSTLAYLLGATTLNFAFLIICNRFFLSKKIVNPTILYLIAGIYGIASLLNFCIGLTADIPIEIFRDVFLLHLFALIQSVLLLVLLSFMTYTLHKKRNLATR